MNTAPARPRNLRLVIEYDGRRYIGWQQQTDQDSVEGKLLHALGEMLQQRVSLTVAGRTDAGVHARAQVANFHCVSTVPTIRFAPGLNFYLPDDISVHSAEEVPNEFSAKSDSLSKYYRYRIYRAIEPAALAARAWHIKKPLDLDTMQDAAQILTGEHDYNAFRSAHCDAPHAIRELYSIDITSSERAPAGEVIEIMIHGNAFCRHMCRIIVGTLAEVALGKRTVQSVSDVLASRDRTEAGVTAPPDGLTLMRVVYPDA